VSDLAKNGVPGLTLAAADRCRYHTRPFLGFGGNILPPLL